VSANQHISEVTNASRTLLLNIRTLEWDPALLQFFGLRESILPRLVSTSEVYGKLTYGPLKDVPLGGLVGDQQGALIGNKCLTQGQAKCTYGTGAFLLFCTGTDIVYSNHGLLSTVRHHDVAEVVWVFIPLHTGCVSSGSPRNAGLRTRRSQ
jgi:glycerol kinase